MPRIFRARSPFAPDFLSFAREETAATADFASPKSLAAYEQVPLSVHLPRGNLGYLRIRGTSTFSQGSVTAGLVLDDDVDR